MKVEITESSPLSNSQSTMLEMHSFLNLMNVLMASLQIAETLINRPRGLADAISLCESMADQLGDRDAALEAARQLEPHRAAVLAALQRERQRAPLSADAGLEFDELVANVVNVFDILRVRVREMLARSQQPEHWIQHSIEQLRQDLVSVLCAIEKNAHKRYHIVQDSSLKEPGDYLATVEIHSVDQPMITIPPVLQDVMRDLTANARKYTQPGGRISVTLVDDGKALTLTVSDEGCGIPPDELTQVVKFGYRATNVASMKTYGGGFGLTKAYSVTRQFGGRMWIDSELGVGTRITSVIPRPDAVSQL